MKRTTMPKLRNGSKGDSNPGSLDCESDILPLSYRAPLYIFRSSSALTSSLVCVHMTLCEADVKIYIVSKLLVYLS